MSTLRKQTRSGYTHISNELIDAEGMSFRAKGIAMVLLSKPDNWTIKIPYLMRVGKEGEKAIRTAMHELAEYGFLMRDRVHESGKVITVTRIADYPAFINVGTVERRINGYQPSTDLAVSDTSGSSTSQNRQVRKGEVLVTPDLITTNEVGHRRKKNSGTPKAKKSYNPEDYDF